MALTFIEPGTDGTFDFTQWTTVSGTFASSSANPFQGPRAIRVTPSGTLIKDGVVSPSGRMSCRYYINSTSNLSGSLFINLPQSGGSQSLTVRGTGTSRVLEVFTNSVVATGSISIPANQWVKVQLAWSWTSSSVNAFRLWINDVLDIDISNVSWSGPPANLSMYGSLPSGSTVDWDQIVLDDSSSMSQPGNWLCTAKLPNADNTVDFDTGIGSGTPEYARVNERPLSVSNGWQHAAATDVQENFTIQNAATGDVDITGATILGYTGWVYGKRGDFDARQVRFIGEVQAKSAGTSLSIPTTNDMVDNGNAIVVAVACDDNGNPGTTITVADSRGNSYAAGQSVQASSTGTAAGVRTALFVALNATALTGTDTITVTTGSVTARVALAYEYAGLITASALDVSNTSVQAGTNAPTTGSTGTLSQANEIVFAAIGAEAEETAFGSTVRDLANVLSHGTTGGGAASNISVQLQALIVNATTALAGGFNTSAETRDFTSVIGAYKAVTGGTSVGDPKLMLNGTEYSKTLTTSNALYTQIVDSASYPSNAAGIGMRSSGTTADTYLYECGVLIAYTPAGAPAAAIQRKLIPDLRANFSRNIRGNFQRVALAVRNWLDVVFGRTRKFQ